MEVLQSCSDFPYNIIINFKVVSFKSFYLLFLFLICFISAFPTSHFSLSKSSYLPHSSLALINLEDLFFAKRSGMLTLATPCILRSIKRVNRWLCVASSRLRCHMLDSFKLILENPLLFLLCSSP